MPRPVEEEGDEQPVDVHAEYDDIRLHLIHVSEPGSSAESDSEIPSVHSNIAEHNSHFEDSLSIRPPQPEEPNNEPRQREMVTGYSV